MYKLIWKLEPKTRLDFSKLKEEKIKIALEKKGYSKTPEDFSFEFLCRRLRDEIFELEFALGEVKNEFGIKVGYRPPNIEEAKKECADVANILDFIFKKLTVRGNC